MANPSLTIKTPRGQVVHVVTKSGKVNTVLEWDPNFGAKYTAAFTRAQEYVDSEVLRFCSARVPFMTGMLQKSGILGTVIGSGEVSYIAIYSRYQYYRTKQTRSYDALRGGLWFERGKASERARILRSAAKIAGGG